MEDSLMGHDQLTHRPMLEGKARAVCLRGETTGTVSSVESDSHWANTLPSAATAELNTLTGDRTDVSSKCSDQYSLHPERDTVCRERRHWNEIKGGQSAQNQVRLCNVLLDKLLVTDWLRKSLCDEAMLYHSHFYSALFCNQTSFDKGEGQKCRNLMATQNKHSNIDCLVHINKNVT